MTVDYTPLFMFVKLIIVINNCIMRYIKKAKWLGVFGITLCGLCCALPVIGAAVGLAPFTGIAFYLEKIGFAALGLAVIILLTAWYKRQTKMKAIKESSCRTDCECKAESMVSK